MPDNVFSSSLNTITMVIGDWCTNHKSSEFNNLNPEENVISQSYIKINDSLISALMQLIQLSGSTYYERTCL